MANRYWVNGDGNWSDTNHWSTTSGGSGGASVPSSSDNVVLTANTITLDVEAYANNFNAGETIIIANNDLIVSGNFDVGNTSAYGTFWTTVDKKVILNSSNSVSLTVPGDSAFYHSSPYNTLEIEINGTGSWSALLQGVKKITFLRGNLTIDGGFFNGSSNFRTFVVDGNENKTLTLLSHDFYVEHWLINNSSALIFIPNHSTIFLGMYFETNREFKGGGLEYYDVITQGTSISINGSNSFRLLEIRGYIYGSHATITFESGTTQYVEYLDISSGSSSPTSLCQLVSSNPGTQYYISVSNVVDLSYVYPTDCYALGEAIPLDATDHGKDGGNNINWLFPFTSAVKTINGLPIANVKTINGLARASMKTFNGLT